MKTLKPTSPALVLAITAVLLASCKKKEAEQQLVFPLTFYGEKVEVISNTRMFTKDGEIKDQQKITKFVKDISYFNVEQDPNGKDNEAIKFLSKEKAYFNKNDALKFDVAGSNGQFLFTSEMKSIYAPTNQNHYKKHILKYQNVKTDGGFASSETREVRVAYGDFKQLRVAMLAYHTSSGNGTVSVKEGGTAINEFNEGVVAYMNTGDTIAVKSYQVICMAK